MVSRHPNKQRDDEALLAWIAILVLTLVFLRSCLVPIPAQAEDRDDALILARCITAEAGRTPGRDAPAILHVLERRSKLPAFAGKNAADVALRYCSALAGRNGHERARRMAALQRADIPAATVRLTDAWVAGARPADPCRGAAHHWGNGTTDSTPLEPVDCGPTENTFYRAAR